MKMKFFVLVLVVIVLFGIIGTKARPVSRELSELEFVRVIGIDILDDELRLTTSVSANTQGEGLGATMLTVKAPTINKAAEEIQGYTNKYIFFGYIAQYIMGEETAREDIRPYIDYIERDLYTRLDTNFYIARDTTAFKVIRDVTSSLSERLDSLRKDEDILLVPHSITFREFLIQLSENGCAVIPTLELVQRQEGDQSTSMSSIESNGDNGKTMRSTGYAIFSDYKLVDFIENENLLGMNVLMGNSSVAALDVVGKDGSPVGLTIVANKVAYEPIFEDGELVKLLIKVQSSANVAEVQGGELNRELNFIRSQAEEKMETQMRNVLDLSQKLNADFLGLGKKIELEEAIKWQKMEKNWEEILPSLDIDIQVAVTLTRTYEIEEAF